MKQLIFFLFVIFFAAQAAQAQRSVEEMQAIVDTEFPQTIIVSAEAIEEFKMAYASHIEEKIAEGEAHLLKGIKHANRKPQKKSARMLKRLNRQVTDGWRYQAWPDNFVYVYLNALERRRPEYWYTERERYQCSFEVVAYEVARQLEPQIEQSKANITAVINAEIAKLEAEQAAQN